MLRNKYSNLSREDRLARIDELTENIANKRLMDLEQSIQTQGVNAHFVGKHGSNTTISQQYNRAVHGIDPITGTRQVNNAGNTIYNDSTRFFSAKDQINSIERAMNIYRRTVDINLAQAPIRYNSIIGEGYKRITGDYGTSRSVQTYFRNGLPVTNFPIYGR
jgi:hypothetical protein